MSTPAQRIRVGMLVRQMDWDDKVNLASALGLWSKYTKKVKKKDGQPDEFAIMELAEDELIRRLLK